MKKIKIAILLLICLGATAQSQEQTPQLLFRAAQCLAVKNFLPAPNPTRLIFGFLLDEKSYPGEKLIYIVNYANPARSSGLVFAIILTEHAGHQQFNIQNNARFALSKGEFNGVSFVDPPLGGTYTQKHLALGIKRIEKQPKFAISVRDLASANPSIICKSYTDHQK
jgi:hypothetical protein